MPIIKNILSNKEIVTSTDGSIKTYKGFTIVSADSGPSSMLVATNSLKTVQFTVVEDPGNRNINISTINGIDETFRFNLKKRHWVNRGRSVLKSDIHSLMLQCSLDDFIKFI